MKKFTMLCGLLWCSLSLFAQNRSWIQVFKPGLSLESNYLGGSIFEEENVQDLLQNKIDLVIPIKSHYGVKVNWLDMAKRLLELKKVEDIGNLAYAIQPKAHQIFWTFQLNHRQLEYTPFIALGVPIRDRINLYGAQTGVSGLHYLKKRYFLLYAGSLGFSEEGTSFDEIQPQLSGAFGAGRILSFNSLIVWGAYLHYANGIPYPVPFFGGEFGLLKKTRVSMLLPSYFKIRFNVAKKWDVVIQTQANSFTTGFARPDNLIFPNDDTGRLGLAALQFRHGILLDIQASKQFRLELEMGYAQPNYLSFIRQNKEFDRYRPLAAPYFRVAFHKSFGKSLLEASLGNLLDL
ncbi:MAG: hypothetical protein AAFV80_08500 [Bacteroidota bacterium]